MARLCMGFVQATGQSHFTEEERDANYRDATYLLYRILFILYAEARDLLPMDNPAYREVSLGGTDQDHPRPQTTGHTQSPSDYVVGPAEASLQRHLWKRPSAWYPRLRRRSIR